MVENNNNEYVLRIRERKKEKNHFVKRRTNPETNGKIVQGHKQTMNYIFDTIDALSDTD